MTRTYKTKSQLAGGYWAWEDIRQSNCMTVFEDSSEPKDSGLLDANGEKLFSCEEKQKIGFI